MSKRVVIIGGDAAGMSAASQARRQDPNLEIIALEKGRWTSYAACGIPYHVSGAISDVEDLVARTPQEFRTKQRIDVRMEHEAMSIDTDRGVVEVRSHEHERTFELGYDELVIATGAAPIRPPLPGINGDNIYSVQTLADASALFDRAEAGNLRNVVVVGAGYIGLEMAEAFLERGAKVTVVDAAAQVMSTLDADMAELVATYMREVGVNLRLGLPVEGFEQNAVLTPDGPIKADLIVLGIGVAPNTKLASEAGIELGPKSAIAVDRQQRTKTDGVWSAGDCATSFHQVMERPVHIALGTVANKQGRIAGVNIGGGYAAFPGVLGTAITKVCDLEVARSGLNEAEATEAGYQYAAVTVETNTLAHYYPTNESMTIKMLAERGSGRLLGAQIVGRKGAGKRIDIVATALTARMTVAEVMELDLAYAPPFSPVWEPIATAARVAAGRV